VVRYAPEDWQPIHQLSHRLCPLMCAVTSGPSSLQGVRGGEAGSFAVAARGGGVIRNNEGVGRLEGRLRVCRFRIDACHHVSLKSCSVSYVLAVP
jgi:hypothetical protein